MKSMYDIRGETGLYHDRLAATSEFDALTRFATYEDDGGHVVQCGDQRPYLDVDGFTFYAQHVGVAARSFDWVAQDPGHKVAAKQEP